MAMLVTIAVEGNNIMFEACKKQTTCRKQLDYIVLDNDLL